MKGISPKGKQMFQSFCKRCDVTRRSERAKSNPSLKESRKAAWQKYAKNNREQRNERQAKYRKDNPHHEKLLAYKRHLKKKFNLDWEDYVSLSNYQDNKCAICLSPFEDLITARKKPHVDHDHTTGIVRGILCGKCNTGIGMLQDSVEVVTSALNYLKNTPFLALQIHISESNLLEK